jgi:hypothetical protein
MTTREKLLRAVLDLPDEELDGALAYVASRRAHSADDWGDLDVQTDSAAKHVMQDLAAEERRAGFSPDWPRPRAS